MAFERRKLGQTGLEVSPMGIGGGYGISGDEVQRAFDQGINYFFYGTWIPTYRKMEPGLRELLRSHRDEVVLSSGAYFWMHSSRIAGAVTKHLKRLGTDHIDLFHLAWVMREDQRRAVDVALELKEKGMIRHLAMSGHKRKMLYLLSQQYPIESIMVRYNAAHPGAEKDIFTHLPDEGRPGVIAFNALKQGKMISRPRGWSGDRPVPTARQSYRFVLTNPKVDLCLSGAKNAAELDDLLEVIAEGPLSDDEMAFMREFGAVLHG
jgi:aryl-alcohol dehydrogenase-like predicted oxidoreductase